MSTANWNCLVYSNEERTAFGVELYAGYKKIYESECIYGKDDAEEMRKELMNKFGIKD